METKGMSSEFVGTEQSAAALQVTTRRIRALIASGRLPAIKVGRDWLIDPADLEKIRARPAGFPRGQSRRRAEKKSEEPGK